LAIYPLTPETRRSSPTEKTRSGGEEIIIEAAISTNRRIYEIINDEYGYKNIILGPNVWPFRAGTAVKLIVDEKYKPRGRL
jgi:hypothetical protein